jgi:hypothetical protein
MVIAKNLLALLNRVPFGKFNRVKFKFTASFGHGYLFLLCPSLNYCADTKNGKEIVY